MTTRFVCRRVFTKSSALRPPALSWQGAKWGRYLPIVRSRWSLTAMVNVWIDMHINSIDNLGQDFLSWVHASNPIKVRLVARLNGQVFCGKAIQSN